jgi:hypothetical protein
VPTTTWTIYEVPNTYVASGTDPTISGVFSLTVVDDDGDLDASNFADGGTDQILTFDGGAVDAYQFYYDDTITINGGTETIKTFQLRISGVTRSFVMNDTGGSIPGATVGTSFTLDGYASYTAIPYTDLLCFAQGTRILTDKGNRPIELLKVGDLVHTKDHGFQPIRWIGKSSLTTRDLLARPHLRPIIVPASSFARHVPERDLYLSPQHRILLSGWQVELNFGIEEALASAKSIVGRNGIRVDMARREVDYYHFMFDQHEVVYSEGLPTESFLVGDTIEDGMDQAMLDEILELFPELAVGQKDEIASPARPILRRFEVSTLQDIAA